MVPFALMLGLGLHPAVAGPATAGKAPATAYVERFMKADGDRRRLDDMRREVDALTRKVRGVNQTLREAEELLEWARWYLKQFDPPGP